MLNAYHYTRVPTGSNILLLCLQDILDILLLSTCSLCSSDYLQKRYQRVKVSWYYSSWTEILTGIPQGSILGSLLFNIYLSDLFLCLEDTYITNYADNNTAYACKEDIESVLAELEYDAVGLIQWFSNDSH